MEDLSFDVGQILTEEEANKLFENAPAQETKPADDETNNEPAEDTEDDDDVQDPEKVGVEEPEEKEDTASQQDDGPSPSAYSSIAEALRDSGIFPDLTDDEIKALKNEDDFAEMFEKIKNDAVNALLDERQKRVAEALGNGVAPDTVRMYEQTLQYLGTINEEVLSAEGDEGENLRRQLIYNDLINRGYEHEKALREVEKSFKSASDIEDAKDALEALTTFYKNGYQKVQDDAKKAAEEAKAKQKKQSDDFRKLVLEDEIKLGETVLDKRTCQRVYDAVSKPIHKDEKTGKLLTAVQKFQMEHPLEFLKQLGMWYVLTDGGKNIDGFTKEAVRTKKNESIKEMAGKINRTTLRTGGGLEYTSPFGGSEDPLLSEGWKVGW